MTFGSALALFGVMLLLALIPGVSVLTVMARSVSGGFVHGLFATLGIVAGDIVLILVAILGLSVLAAKMGDLFVLVRYAGAAYLVWLGISLWRSRPADAPSGATGTASAGSSFLAGLLVTLADQKAILFYFGFLPAFIDLGNVTPLDTAVIVAAATLAVGGAKLGYACIASRARGLLDAGAGRRLSAAAGGATIAVAVILVAGH